MSGLLGMRGVEHVGLTVPDLDAADRFLRDVLGAVMVFDGGAITDADIMTRVLGAEPGAVCRYRFYRLGHGPNLEVFEYAPSDNGPPPGNRRAGGHHLAIYVEDMAAGAAHLAAHGVEMAGPPEHIDEGPAAGSDWLYFRAPWGMQMELVSYPRGKAYEAVAAVKLWSPSRPSE